MDWRIWLKKVALNLAYAVAGFAVDYLIREIGEVPTDGLMIPLVMILLAAAKNWLKHRVPAE